MTLEQKLDAAMKSCGRTTPELLRIIAAEFQAESLAFKVLIHGASSIDATTSLIRWMDDNYTPKNKTP